MDENIFILILTFPTRLKFSLLSTSVFRNLTTFWVENKIAKYLRMQYRHWTLWCDRCHQYITPLLEDHSLHLMVKEDPGGGVWGEVWFLFKYSPFWVEGYAAKHWWWVAAVCKILYNFYVLTIALKKFEEYMKCCLLSNVQVSKNSFSRLYTVILKMSYCFLLKLSFPVFLIMNP